MPSKHQKKADKTMQMLLRKRRNGESKGDRSCLREFNDDVSSSEAHKSLQLRTTVRRSKGTTREGVPQREGASVRCAVAWRAPVLGLQTLTEKYVGIDT